MSDHSKTADAVASADAVAALDWLSVLFARPPGADAVASHRRGPVADLMTRLGGDADLAWGIARMRAALDGDEDDGAAAAKLERAYGLTFEGIGGPRTAPPYESAYRGAGPRRLFQAPTAEMEALLDEQGFTVAADIGLPADHLAVELALAAWLASAGGPASAAMTRRLADWVPDFAADCAAIDRDGFWAGAAAALAALAVREARLDTARQDDRT